MPSGTGRDPCLGEVVRHILITDTSSRDEIEQAMAALTVKANKACIPSTLREIRKDQDECVDLWLASHPMAEA